MFEVRMYSLKVRTVCYTIVGDYPNSSEWLPIIRPRIIICFSMASSCHFCRRANSFSSLSTFCFASCQPAAWIFAKNIRIQLLCGKILPFPSKILPILSSYLQSISGCFRYIWRHSLNHIRDSSFAQMVRIVTASSTWN